MRSVSRRKSERRKKNYNPDLSGVEVAGDIDLSPLPMILGEGGNRRAKQTILSLLGAKVVRKMQKELGIRKNRWRDFTNTSCTLAAERP